MTAAPLRLTTTPTREWQPGDPITWHVAAVEPFAPLGVVRGDLVTVTIDHGPIRVSVNGEAVACDFFTLLAGIEARALLAVTDREAAAWPAPRHLRLV